MEIKTKEGFVIGWSKSNRIDFCWFVRHPMVQDGKPIPVDRGDLEQYLNKCKRQITKTKKGLEKFKKELDKISKSKTFTF